MKILSVQLNNGIRVDTGDTVIVSEIGKFKVTDIIFNPRTSSYLRLEDGLLLSEDKVVANTKVTNTRVKSHLPVISTVYVIFLSIVFSFSSCNQNHSIEKQKKNLENIEKSH